MSTEYVGGDDTEAREETAEVSDPHASARGEDTRVLEQLMRTNVQMFEISTRVLAMTNAELRQELAVLRAENAELRRTLDRMRVEQ